jgi:hypothetical protein
MPLRFVGVALLSIAACSSHQFGAGESGADAGSLANTGVPPVTSFDPDVPTWRGGCFFDGPAGKIVNGSPAPDVRLFGDACPPVGSPEGPGGLVYLDRFDPVSGSGDVTVLSSAPGSAPVVVGRNGGVGAFVSAATGARIDAAEKHLLALKDVVFVTGELVLADLPAGSPIVSIATDVRAENYDFLPGGGVLYVGNYDFLARVGDLIYWNGEAQLLASRASRFDFVMYRLSPARDSVAYLQSFASSDGGDLFLQPLPPGRPAAAVDSGVLAMSWAADGQHLVYQKRNADGVTFEVKSWDVAAGAAQSIAGAPPQAGVNSSAVVGNSIVYADGWGVLSQQATLHVVSVAGGADSLGGPAPVALAFGVAQPPADGESGALAFVGLPAPSDPAAGNLFLASVPSGPTALADTTGQVSPAAGFRFSPRSSFVAYARSFAVPQSPGDASPQPGIAGDLMVASTSGGTPRQLATSASMQQIAWDPLERWVGGIGSFEPATNRGELLVKETATGAQVFSEERVGATSFDFGIDGASLAAIREWDDALQRGELVVVSTGGAAPWTAKVVDEDVTFSLPPRAGRAVYGVRGRGRDGLWLGGTP